LKGAFIELWRSVASLRDEELSIEKLNADEISHDYFPSNAFSYVSPRQLSPQQAKHGHFSTWIFAEPTYEKFKLIPSITSFFVFSRGAMELIPIVYLVIFVLEKAISHVRTADKRLQIPPLLKVPKGRVSEWRCEFVLFKY
ncbi:hypothetical protein PFISCL1PPCAC_26337, partial [Pristionchus fissidentatus]